MRLSWQQKVVLAQLQESKQLSAKSTHHLWGMDWRVAARSLKNMQAKGLIKISLVDGVAIINPQ